jgi:DNA-binding GntR family transcriptional regulator
MQVMPEPSSDFLPIDLEIDREAPTPLHHQVYASIERQIRDGVLRPGDRIQQERQLAATAGISLAPVRQAILALVRDGYLERARGRGTFVRDRAMTDELSVLSSFSSLLNATGRPWEMRLLLAGVVVADQGVTTALRLHGQAVRIRRVAVLADEPIALLDAYLDSARFGALADFDPGDSLYGRLAADFGIRMSSASNQIGIATLTTEEAGLLGRRPKSSALEVISVTSDQHDVATEYTRVLYHPDRFTFQVNSRRYEDAGVRLLRTTET